MLPLPSHTLVDRACSPWLCVDSCWTSENGRVFYEKEREGGSKEDQKKRGVVGFKNKGSELNEPGLNPGSASHWLCKLR